MSKNAMTEVLEAIEEVAKHIGRFDPPMQPNYLVLRLGTQADTLRRLISEQEQGEPVGVAHLMQEGFTHCIWSEACVPVGTKFYTTPYVPEGQQQRPSRSDIKPLTDDEIWKNDNIMAANSRYGANFETLREVIRAIEAAHGIKE